MEKTGILATDDDALSKMSSTDALREHVFLGREGELIQLTISIGVATCPTGASSGEEFIDQADKAMCRAKEAARDVVYAAGTG